MRSAGLSLPALVFAAATASAQPVDSPITADVLSDAPGPVGADPVGDHRVPTRVEPPDELAEFVVADTQTCRRDGWGKAANTAKAATLWKRRP